MAKNTCIAYAGYSKNVKPGLSEANRVKQVVFAKHVHNRWGLEKGKREENVVMHE